MSIWFHPIDLTAASARHGHCMDGHLGIELVAADDESITARMPVDRRIVQPAGLRHGRTCIALAETLASWAATFVVDPERHDCVGLEINANHTRAARDGHVTGIARPVHLGRATHVRELRVADDRARLCCVSRVTMAVLDGCNPTL